MGIEISEQRRKRSCYAYHKNRRLYLKAGLRPESQMPGIIYFIKGYAGVSIRFIHSPNWECLSFLKTCRRWFCSSWAVHPFVFLQSVYPQFQFQFIFHSDFRVLPGGAVPGFWFGNPSSIVSALPSFMGKRRLSSLPRSLSTTASGIWLFTEEIRADEKVNISLGICDGYFEFRFLSNLYHLFIKTYCSTISAKFYVAIEPSDGQSISASQLSLQEWRRSDAADFAIVNDGDAVSQSIGFLQRRCRQNHSSGRLGWGNQVPYGRPANCVETKGGGDGAIKLCYIIYLRIWWLVILYGFFCHQLWHTATSNWR